MDILAHGAIQTTDTVRRIRIVGNPDLCRTHLDTETTVNTLSLYFESHEADPVEMGVDRTERTERAAERSACDDKENEKNDQDRDFENIEPPHHVRLDYGHGVHGIQWIPDDPGYAGAQCPPRADPAEPVRLNKVWQKNGETEERYVFTVLQHGMNAELLALDLERLVLNPAERAEPSADGSAKDHSDRAEKTNERERDFADLTEVLKDADRTGSEGSRAGVAVESREAYLLQRTAIDFF